MNYQPKTLKRPSIEMMLRAAEINRMANTAPPSHEDKAEWDARMSAAWVWERTRGLPRGVAKSY